MIVINGKQVSAIHLGTQVIKAVYVGALKVWDYISGIWKDDQIWNDNKKWEEK